MENISCHSFQSSYPTGTKTHTVYVEANVIIMCMYCIIYHLVSKKIFLTFLFENLPFVLPWQPIKFRNLDKSYEM